MIDSSTRQRQRSTGLRCLNPLPPAHPCPCTWCMRPPRPCLWSHDQSGLGPALEAARGIAGAALLQRASCARRRPLLRGVGRPGASSPSAVPAAPESRRRRRCHLPRLPTSAQTPPRPAPPPCARPIAALGVPRAGAAVAPVARRAEVRRRATRRFAPAGSDPKGIRRLKTAPRGCAGGWRAQASTANGASANAAWAALVRREVVRVRCAGQRRRQRYRR